MITKDDLKAHFRLICEIRDLQDEIRQLKSLRDSVGATKYDYVSSGGNGNVDLFADKLAKLNDLLDYYVLRVEECIIQQRIIEQAIEALPVTERCLMRYRYIDGLNWVDVAAKMNYSWKQVHRIHDRALKILMMTHNDIQKVGNI